MNSKHKLDEKALQENELISWADKKLGNLKPYWQQIVLAVALGFLAFVAVTYFVENRASQEAAKWQDLTTSIWNTENVRDIKDLTNFAQTYPNDPAGLWALQLAGDYELRSGIQQFPVDRKAGLDKAKKAVGLYQQVVDSNGKKSTMLQRRSIFGLAYASESAGEFESARKYYQQVIEEGEASPFFEAATRGFQRSSSDAYIAVFNKFRDWEDSAGIAPGPRLPTRPDISFPEIEALSPASGGDFGSTNNDPSGKPVMPAAALADQTESNVADQSAIEKTDEKVDQQANESDAASPEANDAGDPAANESSEKESSEKESSEKESSEKESSGTESGDDG